MTLGLLLTLLLWWTIYISEGAYLGARVVRLLYDWTAGGYDRLKDFDRVDDLAFLAKATWASTAVFAVAAAIVWSAGLGIGWLWASLTLFMVVRAATLHLRYRTDLWLVTGATK